MARLWRDVASVLGIEGDRIDTAQHEAWATSLEAYFLRGKAPAPGLRGAVASFSDWLRPIFRTFPERTKMVNEALFPLFDRLFGEDAPKETRRNLRAMLAASLSPLASLFGGPAPTGPGDDPPRKPECSRNPQFREISRGVRQLLETAGEDPEVAWANGIQLASFYTAMAGRCEGITARRLLDLFPMDIRGRNGVLVSTRDFPFSELGPVSSVEANRKDKSTAGSCSNSPNPPADAEKNRAVRPGAGTKRHVPADTSNHVPPAPRPAPERVSRPTGGSAATSRRNAARSDVPMESPAPEATARQMDGSETTSRRSEAGPGMRPGMRAADDFRDAAVPGRHGNRDDACEPSPPAFTAAELGDFLWDLDATNIREMARRTGALLSDADGSDFLDALSAAMCQGKASEEGICSANAGDPSRGRSVSCSTRAGGLITPTDPARDAGKSTRNGTVCCTHAGNGSRRG
ncbi:MAG: hypothetical protein LBR22_00700 [Desulfovibrio sp.]|nr:hypothetical protein [Desulfovibrio sp.]